MTASSVTSERQLVFDFAREPSYTADAFLTSSSNAHARTMIERWPDWPERVLLMVGPAGSGKSHLAAIWTRRAADRCLTTTIIEASTALAAGALIDLPKSDNAAVLIEDCDRANHPETALFHLINLIQERRGWLLITARTRPNNWHVQTPDLLSRLRLAPTVEIQRPDASLIYSVLQKLFRDRQIRVDPDVMSYAALHGEQSLDAINRFASAIDDGSLAEGRRITRQLATRTLASLDHQESSMSDGETPKPVSPPQIQGPT